MIVWVIALSSALTTCLLAPTAAYRSFDSKALASSSRRRDFNGLATNHARDAQGNATSESSADIGSNTTQYNALGLPSGSPTHSARPYSRDAFGRVIVKTQALASGLTEQLVYSYTAAGQLATITYPNGNILTHGNDATGRFTQLSRNGSALVTGIAWNPGG